MTATRVTFGAISSSSSSHLPPRLYSSAVKPVALRPGCARLSTKPAPTGSATNANTIGTPAGRLQQRCYGACARRHNNVRCKHGQLCRVFAELVGVAHPPPIFDLEVVPDRPAQTLKLLHKGHNARCASMSSADRFISMPTRRTLLFWARDASGHAAAPPTNVMNSRRFIAPPKLGTHSNSPHQ